MPARHPTIFVALAPASAMRPEGELEQIQFLLGHASVQTTERYIVCRPNFREAVNDRFRISPSNNAAHEV
jgi:integrase